MLKMLPEQRLRNMRRRVNRARKFPTNTCGASRHVHMMADALASGKGYRMLEDEPKHCAESLYAVLESLWKARTELAALHEKAEPGYAARKFAKCVAAIEKRFRKSEG